MNKHNNPKISIVTPCLNSERYIAEAVDSVLEQDWPNFEHIVVDGGSTDGTLGILADYPHLRVISEQDDGLYDALNKGMAIADGELFGWLNADDYYSKDAFRKLAEYFQVDKSLKMACGACDVIEKKNTAERVFVRRFDFTPDRLFSKGVIRHQGVLLNSGLYDLEFIRKVGRFKTEYMICGDRDYLIRIAQKRPSCKMIDDSVYIYRQHGDSLTFGDSQRFNLLRWDENIALGYFYLVNSVLTDNVKRYCKHFFRKAIAKKYRYYRASANYRQALYSLRPAWRADPALLLRFLGRVATKPLRIIF